MGRNRKWRITAIGRGSRFRRVDYQQNLNALPLAVVVILAKANTIEAIRPAYAELLEVLKRLRPCEFVKLSAP